MKKIAVLFCLIICFVSAVFSQKYTKFRLGDVSLWTGIQTYDFLALDDYTFSKFVSQPELRPDDFDDYNWSDHFWGRPLQTTFLGVKFGFNIINKDRSEYKLNPTFNLGLSYANTTLLASDANNSEYVVTDSLISTSGLEVWYKGIQTNYHYERSYEFEQIGLNAELLYRYNPDGRWAFYGGLSVNVFFSINSRATENYSYNSYEVYRTQNNSQFTMYNNNLDYLNETKIHQTKLNFSLIASLPLGIDFQIAKKNPFWNKIHLLVGAEPTLNMFLIPEIGNIISANVLVTSGLKIDVR